MKAMILAAGYGTRMGDLTRHTPKPLIRLGSYSLIEWHLLKLCRAGIHNVVINTYYQSEKLRETLQDGKRLGVHILWSREEQLLGSGGGAKNALPLLGKECFLLISADVWLDADYAELIQGGGWSGSQLAHLFLVDNPDHNPNGDFSLLDNRWVASPSTQTYTYSGFSIVSPDLFAGEKRRVFSFSESVHNHLADRTIGGSRCRRQWIDVGTPERLKKARLLLSTQA